MSKDIFETDELQVTAFVGATNKNPMLSKCVQISCKGNNDYACLNGEEALLLAHSLIARVIGLEGYRATD